MTMKKKKDGKKGVDLPVAGGRASGKGAVGGVAIEEKETKGTVKVTSKEELKTLTVKIAEEKGSLPEIVRELQKKTGLTVSDPTVSDWLTEKWGKNDSKKRQEMRDRRSNTRRWKKDFTLARSGIDEDFHRDYLSSSDGIFLDRENKRLEYIPRMSDTERAYKKKDIIHFVKEAMFGYSPDEDQTKAGVYDPAVKSILLAQLKRRLDGMADDKYKRLAQAKFEDKMDTHDSLGTFKGMSLGDQDKFERKVLREVRKGLATKREEFKEDAKKDFDLLQKQLDTEGIDSRSAVLSGKDLLDRNLCPAFASSSKKFRGKQRMLTKEGIDPETGKPYVFSEVVYNIPFLLWNHAKRLQVMSHNMAKDLPELLKGERPVVKGREDNLMGRNLRIRMPKDPKEDILTREAGIVITEETSKNYRYYRVVESNAIMAESLDKIPETFRIDAPIPKSAPPIKNYAEFKTRVTSEALDVQRGDPLVFGGFKDLESSPGYAEAKHSGTLIYVGKPVLRHRTITVDPDVHVSGKEKVEIPFWTQDYVIIREDDLKIGDKIISRNGLKGVVSEVVDTLGKDEKGRPYDAVVNYGEVWREADKSDPEYKIKEDTFIKQGKKKSGVVREHEAGDGQVFFFLIDKMAQDQSTTGLRMSTTMFAGMWEWFLTDLGKDKKKFTQEELNVKLQKFVEQYFGDKGTFIPSLKAMHYKAVKKGNKVKIVIDESEPKEDDDGKVVRLPHTYAGRTYDYAYIPNYLSRVYFDGKTLREHYQVATKGMTSASDYQWSHIVKQVKNRMYLFPRNEDAVNLVAVPIYNGRPENYDTVVMDHIDYINAGGNPYDENPTITLRKEPVTDKNSIQTHPVRINWDGKYAGCMGIHPAAALMATIDYDGDQVVAFTPSIENARVKITDEELEELKSLKNKKYDTDFSDLYKKAKVTKYANDEQALGVSAARYNQETAEVENTTIQQFGGLKKRSILLFGAEKHEPLRYGSKKDPREAPVSPDTVNQVCDVEKILKMREPRWVVKALEKRDWDSLTDSEKFLVKDYHIRRELKRRLQQVIDANDLHRLKDIIRDEKSFIEDQHRDRSVDPINLEIEIGNRLIDRVIWQQLRGRKDILEEED